MKSGEKIYAGVDIGGTKTAVVLMTKSGLLIERKEVKTYKGKDGWNQTVEQIVDTIKIYKSSNNIESIGISCGGSLNSRTGVIASPPNLPGWDNVPIVKILNDEFGIPAYLENDANASVLAEWKYGAGKGKSNVIFLTFGTGLGAGIIINGKLFTGTNDFGGEIGHIRLADEGPIGYHKRGSFEGFCSGTGLAQMMAFELLCLAEEIGKEEMLKIYKEPGIVSGKNVVDWAFEGDSLALSVINKSGNYLGKGLSILIDILNPEIIIIGSMGVRLGELLFAPAREVISREALFGAAEVCEIVPAKLGESVGDFGALCVAQNEIS